MSKVAIIGVFGFIFAIMLALMIHNTAGLSVQAEALKDVQTSLRLARGEYPYFANDIERDVKDHKLSLAEIGTDIDELNRLKRLGKLKGIQTSLRLARGEYPYFAEDIERDARDNSISLAEIGTNLDELKKLKRLGKIKNAKTSLKHARGEYPFFVSDVKTILEGTDITLKEIGTSKGEVIKLEQRASARKEI